MCSEMVLTMNGVWENVRFFSFGDALAVMLFQPAFPNAADKTL